MCDPAKLTGQAAYEAPKSKNAGTKDQQNTDKPQNTKPINEIKLTNKPINKDGV